MAAELFPLSDPVFHDDPVLEMLPWEPTDGAMDPELICLSPASPERVPSEREEGRMRGRITALGSMLLDCANL